MEVGKFFCVLLKAVILHLKFLREMITKSLRLFIIGLFLPLIACLLLALQAPPFIKNEVSNFQKDTTLAAELMEKQVKLMEDSAQKDKKS